MAQLGRAFSIVARNEAQEMMLHADVDAFYAPSECHDVVARGEHDRRRKAHRHAKSVSGLNRRQFRIALNRLSQRHFDRMVGNILSQDYGQ